MTRTSIDTVLQYRKIVVFFFICLLVSGSFAISRMPRQEDPSFTWNAVRVMIQYPGADPSKVEKFVTKPVEKEIRKIDNVEEIISFSKNNISVLDVKFVYDSDIQKGIDELKEKVYSLELPKACSFPEVYDDLTETYQVIAGITGDNYSLQQLEIAAEQVKESCQEVSGVAKVELRGEPEEVIFVSLNLQTLSKYPVPIDRIFEALSARNDFMPAGNINLQGKDFILQTKGEFKKVEDLATMIVDISGTSGHPIFLNDIASIELKNKTPEYKVRMDGKPAVAIVISMRKNYNIVRLGEEIKELIQEQQKIIPPGMEISVHHDQPLIVEETIDAFLSNLYLGIILVIIVVFLFMGLREALIVSFTIPISIICSFSILGMLGIHLHQVSISGFIAVLGLLVDNPIVIIENIRERHTKAKESLLKNISEAVKEIAPSITSGTLTTIAACLPLAFMSGATGEFIYSLPIVVITTLICSLAVSLGLTPIFYFWSAKRIPFLQEQKKPPLLLLYQKGVLFALRKRYFLALLAFLLILVASWQALIMGRQLFPSANRAQFFIGVTLLEGTTIHECEQTAISIEKLLLDQKQFPEIDRVACFLGNGVPKFYYNEFGDKGINNPAYMEVLVNLKKQSILGSFRSREQVMDSISEALYQKIPREQVEIRQLQQGPPVRYPISVKLSGPNLDILHELTEELKESIKGIKSTKNVNDNLGEPVTQIHILTEPYRLNRLGLTHIVVANTVHIALSGKKATTFLTNDKEIDVIVRLHEQDRKTLDDLEDLYFASPYTQRKIPFASIGKLDVHLDSGVIYRHNEHWASLVYCYPNQKLADLVLSEIHKKISQKKLPRDFTVTYEGEDKELKKAFHSLFIAGGFALLLIYLILAAEFNSLLQPIIILIIIPLALAGAVIGLSILGYPLSFSAFLGAVSLTGIVVNDAIIIVDYANYRSRKQGTLLEVWESYSDILVESSEKRLIAILATSITTVGGFLPLALFGGDFWSPLAYVMIFGMIFSTALTLIFVPVFFRILEDVKTYMGIITEAKVLIYNGDLQLEQQISYLLDDKYSLHFETEEDKFIETIRVYKPDIAIIGGEKISPQKIHNLVRRIKQSQAHTLILIISSSSQSRESFLQEMATSRAQSMIEANVYLPREEIDDLPMMIKQSLGRIRRVMIAMSEMEEQA